MRASVSALRASLAYGTVQPSHSCRECTMKRFALELAGFFVSALLPGVLVWAITRKKPS